MTLAETKESGKPHQLEVLAAPDGSFGNPFARKNAKALDLVLREREIEFRYNTRDHRVERLSFSGAWIPATDRSMADLRETIGDGYFVKTDRGASPLAYGRERWHDCLDALLHHREVDPFAVWLDGVDEWDGEARLDLMLSRLFGADDDDLTRWSGRYLFLGAIQRTFEPGCKLDEMPILSGPQGIGKSALLRSILPPGMSDMHTDALRWDAPPEKQIDIIIGPLIIEVSEMAGRRKADIEQIKQFVTRQDDRHRRPYARHAEQAPRRFVMCGTTNDPNDLPNDPSGLRRFVPVRLKHGSNVELWMDICRNHLWAEALHRWCDGERANLPRDLQRMQAERAEEHRDADLMAEDAIAALPRVDMTLSEVADQLPERLRAVSDNRIGRALRNAGWTLNRKRRDGRQVRVWEPVTP